MLILCMLVDIGLKFFAEPSWPTMGDLEVKVTDLEILCSYFGKVFRTLISLEHLDGSC